MPLISADQIFNGYDFLPTNTVLEMSDEGVVVAIFQTTNFDNVKMYQGLLMPGMINAHCHLELSHLKDKVPKRQGLVQFLLSILSGREQVSAEEKKLAIERAEDEMQRNGIVAVGDICNTSDTLYQKSKGKLCYHTFVECYGLKPERAFEIRNQAMELQQQFLKFHRSSVVLHAPYSVSNRLITLVDEINGAEITTIHNQECEAENELFLSGTGDLLKLFDAIQFNKTFFEFESLNSIRTYLPKCVQQKKMILVHNTVSSKQDVQWANGLGKEMYWCLCPKANLFIENSLPDIEMMMGNGCQLVLGTDSLASNDTLSIWEEVKTILRHKPDISIVKMLQWATINGAKALEMDSMLGSFEVGKKPGVIQMPYFPLDNFNQEGQNLIHRIY